MFKIASEPLQVLWPVTIEVPAEGGNITEQAIKARFKVLPSDEFMALMNEGKDEATAVAALLGGKAKDHWLAQVITGWEDVLNEKGKPMNFNKANLNELLGISYVRRGLEMAYFECAAGRKSKNSWEPSSTG